MRKHNILYLHNKAEISGGERSLLSLWENIDRDLFQLFLVVPFEGEFSLQAKQRGVEVIILSFSQLRPWNFLLILKSIIRYIKILIKYKIDLIHSHTARNNILSALIGRILHIPVIWHERNILINNEIDITRMFLFLPQAIICNSMAVAYRIKGLSKKVHVILNGVDLEYFQPLLPNLELKKRYNIADINVVGIVTNLTLRRRVEYFIEAAEAIHRREPNAIFFIVGGEFEQASRGRLNELQEYARTLGLQDCVFLIGYQSDVRPWISIFDVSCHVTSQDACSRSVLEAMAMGKAIVAMNDGGNGELIENNQSGILVDPFDRDEFVHAVMSFLTNESIRMQYGLQARARAQQFFDIRRNANETVAIYVELLNRK